MQCSKCGHLNKDAFLFCSGCGEPLAEENKTGLIDEHPNDGTESLNIDLNFGNAAPQAVPEHSLKRKEKKKTKFPFILAIIIVIIVGGAAGAVFGVSALNTKKYDELIDTGNKYLEELKYEEAVEKYLEAIDVKPKREEAYVGAATSYINLDKPEKAKDILEKGLENIKEPGKHFTDLCDELGVVYKDDATAAENDLSANDLVFNNGGLYVKYGDNVYYREYMDASIEKNALFGNYGYVSNTGKNMVCLHGDGTKEVLFEDFGEGSIYICENRMILQNDNEMISEKDREIYSVSLDGSNYSSYGKGYVFAIDEKSNLLICNDSKYGGRNLFTIEVKSGEKKPLTACDNFVAFHEGVVYYTEMVMDDELSKMGKVILCSIKSDGSEKMVLAETEPNLYDYSSEYPTWIYCLQIVNDYLYFSYGTLGGHPPFFQGGNISRVKKDGSGYEILVGRKANGVYDDLVGSDFFVAKTSDGENLYYCSDEFSKYYYDETITAKGYQNGTRYVMNLHNKSVDVTSVCPSPLGSPFVENKEVFVYLDNSGQKTKLIAASDYANPELMVELSNGSASSQNEYLFDINGIEVVDGWVFYKTEYSKFNEEETAGRSAPLYDRILSKVYRKNLDTGTVELLYSY